MNRDGILSYYDNQAFAYYSQTREANFDDIYSQFIDNLTSDSVQTVLDAGCGMWDVVVDETASILLV